MPGAGPRIAVVGAGPVGLEAALYAATLGLPVTVYERGRVGEHLRQWGHVRLFSPFGMNSTPLARAAVRAARPREELPAEGDLLTGREHVSAYLEALAALPALRDSVRTETAVLAVSRRGLLKHELPGDARRGRGYFRVLVRGAGGKERDEEADVVLDCTGTYGQPRWLGEGGAPAVGETSAWPHLAHGLEDILGERRAYYADKT